MKFKVKIPKLNIIAEFQYDFGSDLQDAIQKFGEDTVFKLYHQRAVDYAQNFARGKLKAGLDIEEVQRALNKWRLDEASRIKEVRIKKLAKEFAKLSRKEKQEALKKIKDLI